MYSFVPSRGKFYLSIIGHLQRSSQGEKLAYSAYAEKAVEAWPHFNALHFNPRVIRVYLQVIAASEDAYVLT